MSTAKIYKPQKYPSKRKYEINLDFFKQWILTNSFDNNYINVHSFDLRKIEEIKKAIKNNPYEISKIIESTETNKNVLLSLIYLSDSTFSAKRYFKKLFFSKVEKLEDLYFFIKQAKRIRGLGSIICKTINEWLVKRTAKDLEREYIQCRKKYGWSLADVIKVTHPNPENREKSILYSYIINNTIYEENRKYFPYIDIFELLKISNGNAPNLIRYKSFKNFMIPGNVKRSPEVLNAILNNMNRNELFFYLPILAEKNYFINSEYFEKRLKNIIFSEISVLEAMIVLERMLELNSNQEILAIVYDIVLKVVFSYTNNMIHIVNTDQEMLNKDLKYIHLSSAKIASVISRKGKQCFNSNGEDFIKYNLNSIIEAEGFVSKKVDYKKVFSKLKDYNNETICLWTKDIRGLGIALNEFKKLDKSNRLIIINFCEKTNYKAYEDNVYCINNFHKDSLRVMNLIEKRMV